MLLALKLLGLKFCIKTIFGVFTLTFFLSVIQQLASGVSLLRDQPFMACVIGASFCGGGIGVAFCANGSRPEVLYDIMDGRHVGTRFLTQEETK